MHATFIGGTIMNLSHFLRTNLVLIDEKVHTKEQAIVRLIEKFVEEFPSLNKDTIFTKVHEREGISSTTYKNGVAIPHARIENFDDIIVCVLIPETPIKDGNHDIRILFLILTGIAQSNLYLNVLASIARICHDESNIQRLISSKNSDDFLAAIDSFGEIVKKIIYARDLMSSPPIFLFPESTIKDALNMMSKHGIEYIPICDGEGHMIGEVNILDILSVGLPPYTQMLTNLKFLSSLEPMEELLKNEAIIPLKSIMKKPSIMLAPDSYVIEVIFQFVKNPWKRWFPVVEHNTCVGVISDMDIVNKFLRV
jgi:nitrogen PTS system EIIA component